MGGRRVERLATVLALLGALLLSVAGGATPGAAQQPATPSPARGGAQQTAPTTSLPTAVEPTAAPPPLSDDGSCDPVGLLEAPATDRVLRGIVTVGGWAIDRASPAGTGVYEVQVFLDGYPAESGHTFIGKAEYGGSRVDVAQQYNDVRFARSAFNLSWDASTAGAGPHTLLIIFRTRCGWASLTQQVEVDGPSIILMLESPPQGAQLAGAVRVQGWAADPRAASGTGVEDIDIYIDGQITTRGVPQGEVPYGEPRQDVGASLGGDSEAKRVQFTRSGFSLNWNPSGVGVGSHELTVYARGPDGPVARSITVEVTAASGAARTPTPVTPGGGALRSGNATFGLGIGTITASSAALSWSPAPGAVSYAVYAAQGSAAFFPAQSGLIDTSVVVAGLAPSRTYRFFVRALDPLGTEIGQSNTVSVATNPAGITITPIPTNPPRPSPTMPNQF